MANDYTRVINIYVSSGDAEKVYNTLAEKQGKLIESVDKLKAAQKQAWEEFEKGSAAAKTRYDELGTKIDKYQAEIGTLKKKQEDAFKASMQGGEKEKKLFDELTAKLKAKETAITRAKDQQQRLQQLIATGNPRAKAAYDSLTEKIKQGEAAINTATLAMDRQKKKVTGELSPSLRDLEATVRRLKNEVAKMSPDDDGFLIKNDQLQTAEAALRSYAGSLTTVKAKMQELGREALKVGVGVLIGNTIQAGLSKVTSYFSGALDSAAKRSDMLADVRKTTGLTQKAVEDLDAAFKNIDTRSSREQLREIAIVAGQLGVSSKEDVLAFTGAIDKLNVALGDEFQGGAGQISDEIGRLRNVLTDLRTGSLDEDLLRIGNGLNYVASQGSATGPVMVDISNRIGGVGRTFGLSSGQILGTSAAIQELNINAERGGTAFNRILLKMSTNVEAFAKIAGAKTQKEVQDFARLVNTDIFAAFQKLIEGARKSGDNTIALAQIMDDLKIDGAGAAELFTKLGDNMDLWRTRVDQASEALTNTDSITQEFNIKNENLAANLEKLNKEFSSIASNKAVTSFLSEAVNTAREFITWLKGAFKVVGDYKEAILLTATAVLTFRNASKLAAAENALMKLKSVELIDVFKKTTGAFNGLSAAFRANPIGAVLTAIQLVTAAFFMYKSAIERARKEQEELHAAQKSYDDTVKRSLGESNYYFDQLKQSNVSLEQRKALIDEINSKYGTYLGYMLKETASLGEIEAAQKLVNKELLKNIIINDNKEKITGLLQKQQELKDFLRQIQEGSVVEENGLVMRVKVPFVTIDGKMYGAKQLAAEIEKIQREIMAANELMNARFKDNNLTAAADAFDPEGLGKVNPPVVVTEEDKKALKKKEKRQKEIEELLRDLKKLYKDAELLGEDADDNEIKRIEDKYNKLLEKAREYGIDLQEIMDTAAEMQGVAGKGRESYLAELKVKEAGFAAIADMNKKWYAEGILTQEEYNDATLANELNAAKAKVDTAKAYSGNVKKAKEDLLKFEKEYNDNYYAALVDAGAKENAERKRQADEAAANEKIKQDKIRELQEMAIQTFGVLLNAFTQIAANIDAAKLKSIETSTERQQQKLEENRKNNITSEKQYQLEKKAIEERAEKQRLAIQKKAFAREQALKIAQVTLETAFAAFKMYTTTLAALAFMGPAAIPIAAAAAGLVAVQGAAQIAVISSQTPGYKEGGYTGDGDVNAPAGVVHKQEFVMPAEQTKQYRSVLEAMRGGNLSPLRNLATSQLLNTLTVRTPNTDAMIKSINAGTNNATDALLQQQIEQTKAMREELAGMREGIESIQDLKVIFDMRRFHDTEKQIMEINKNQIG